MSLKTLAKPPHTKAGVLYCLIFPSGKRYVGVTTRQFHQRAKEHCKNAKYRYRQNEKAVTRAIRKYGPDKVKVWVLAQGLELSTLLHMEVQTISEMGTYGVGGYNMTAGGEGSVGWFIASSPEMKAKIVERSSRVLSQLWERPEFREAIVKGTQERSRTPEYRDIARKRIEKLNADPDFVKIRDATLRSSFGTEKWWDNFSESVRKRSENTAWVEAQGRRLREYYDDPENMRLSLERLAKMNADPEFQKMRIARSRAVTTSAEFIERQTAVNKARAKIPEADYIQVHDLYAYGFNGKEVASMLGVGRQTIYNILAKLGTKTRSTAKAA